MLVEIKQAIYDIYAFEMFGYYMIMIQVKFL